MSTTQKIVKKYLKDNGWSIVAASERSGLPVVTIKSIIYGKSTNHKITTLEKLARAFNCKVNDLINTTDDKNDDEELDLDLFKDCLKAVENFLIKNKINFDQKKIQQIVNNLFSLLIKKKRKEIPYYIDEEIIEWIIDNMTN